MDAQVVIAMLGLSVSVGAILVGITMYAVKARGVAEAAGHKARGVEGALTTFKATAELIFARKDTIDAELRAVRGTVERIAEQQDKMMDRQTAIFDRLMGPGV